ncbi:MAG: response regulator [Lachnospiraceae bacterium]|nr:response regulator [Lachnospiraceae bacterium]
MQFEDIVDVLAIFMNIAALMMCLFAYLENTKKTLAVALIFFLGNMLSNYYWGVYILVMDDYPNVSSALAYFGWNLAFMMLAVMQYLFWREPGIRRLSPVSLLPALINIPQLFLYMQFGGYFNNIWQVFFTTVVACLAFDCLVWYAENRKDGARFPYVSAVVLVFITVEYAAWTSSCFDWPSEILNPYNYLILIADLCYVLIPVAIIRYYRSDTKSVNAARDRIISVFKPVYIIIVTIFCIGGFLLGIWIRNTLDAGIGRQGDSDPYSIIAVILFIVSFIIVTFTIMIMLIFSSEQKSYEREELAAAKYLAERSNAAKSDFLAQMSHEIRTPINAVLGINEMVLRESLEARDELPDDRDEIRNTFSEICNYSGNIDNAGKNLLTIINDILDFSKIEAGKLEIIDNDYQLSSLLNDVSNMMVFKARQKGLECVINVDANMPDAFHGDEVRIRQIATNLLNNAVKYTQKGRVILSVSEHKDDDMVRNHRTDLVISVKDTGIGIREEDKERLFGKFERLDIERNSSIEGTGLGLAITSSLAKMMGGTIDFESEYGKGSTFTATIPQTVVSYEPIGDLNDRFEKSIRELKAKKEPFHAKDAHILVVDDTPTNHMVVKGLLRKTMINIDTALSGEASIELASKHHYDIILMDQRMPGMDGTAAMQHIREDKKGINYNTPFICLTADAISGARERYIAKGFNDYLTKPIDSRALEEILLKYLPQEKIKKTESMSGGTPDPVKPKQYNLKPDASVLTKEHIIDRKAGLELCEGDEELYGMILATFSEESPERAEAIEKNYKERNWKEYGVYVHSLKSSAKMIGAIELSDIAKRMETAALDGRTDEIEKDHNIMMDMYHKVMEELK